MKNSWAITIEFFKSYLRFQIKNPRSPRIDGRPARPRGRLSQPARTPVGPNFPSFSYFRRLFSSSVQFL